MKVRLTRKQNEEQIDHQLRMDFLDLLKMDLWSDEARSLTISIHSRIVSTWGDHLYNDPDRVIHEAWHIQNMPRPLRRRIRRVIREAQWFFNPLDPPPDPGEEDVPPTRCRCGDEHER